VKMLTFALGRGVEYYDRRAVDAIAAEVRPRGIDSRASSWR
jgi:hypothetical protein